MNIGRFLRNCGVDAHRLSSSGMSFRLLEHDLPRLVDRRNPVVFDVGANKGQTIEMLLRLFAEPRIFSFEPARELAERLAKNFTNHDVTVECCALGAHPGEQDFLHYSNNELSSILPLSKDDTNPFSTVEVTRRETVTISTVDEYALNHQLTDLDLLKVDTQGYDLEVLKGAEGVISSQSVRVIQVETNFVHLYDGQCSAGQIIEWLGVHRYFPVAFYEVVRCNGAMSWATVCFISP